ncbi:response regulator [Rubellimicrobium aerolatum]|uniref:Response regulator n=1 Tax=Rubellimicrobium aerolatum TaxID=490979 RepID=A0ABW0SFS6_9RHOB|nr:response regulator [Rubellimicrobium aerolatum]MBP1807279.1 CheY-like chemotaxis protein [Rubellimicrobium aerolatum]
MNILICEDDPIIAMDLAWTLEELGHAVLGTVASAAQCLSRCEERRPDLVTVDLTLIDGRTGLGLVAALAERGIPSIIVSGEARLVPRPTPALAVLEKPFREDLLARALSDLDGPRRA